MRDWTVDLYSDTKTRPTPAMRAAMAAAAVGDEQQDEDPTVAALTTRVASLLGKSAALFLPSGTMANVVATMVHCARGDEIYAAASSHLLHYETGGAAGLAGAQVTPLIDEGGLFTPETLIAALRPSRWNAPRPRLVWLEQTTNMGGGRVWPLDQLRRIRAVADEAGLAVHLDGARLLNAAVAHDVAATAYGEIADSLWLDFSKGLGAPFGAVLAGSEGFIARARRCKHMLGGAMRQAGIMAAACLYALDHHVDRLADDHALAKALEKACAGIPGVQIERSVETNIILLDVTKTGQSAAALLARMASAGVRMGAFGAHRLRAITHLDIPPGGIDRAVAALREALA